MYAVLPGPQQVGANKTPSALSFHSRDLGWYVIGMDTGDLDGDGEDEVVVGGLVDAGNYDDWLAGDLTKNRAKLVILDDPGTGSYPREFSMTELTGDNIAGAGAGNGLGSGVFGVKIDDVNADGLEEIWCTDGLGHVYLFHQADGPWKGWYRSGHVGSFPGAYNNLFPIKDGAGRTIRLVVVSSGYVMAFTVDHDQVPVP